MAAIGVFLGLAALVWGGLLLWRGGPLAGCLALLVSGCCFGAPFLSVPAEPIPLTIDRALWGVLLAQAVLWRRLGLAVRQPWSKSEWLLVALIGALAFSTFTHDWQARGHQAAGRLLFFYVMPMGIYLVARQIAWTERGARLTMASLAAFGLYLAVTSFAETHQLWWLVFPKYVASTESSEFFFGRGRGPFLNPVACGLYQSVCLCAAVMAWPRLGRFGKLALPVIVAIYAMGLYGTLTRSVWIGAGLSVLLVVGLALSRSWRVALLTCALVLGAITAATRWERLLAFNRDAGHSAAEAAESIKLRPILAQVAWRMFQDRPWLGCGFGQYLRSAHPYLADRTTDLPLEKARPYVQHNAFLALLTETGLIGAGLFTSLLFFWARAGWRVWQRSDAPLWYRQLGLLLLACLAAYLPNAMFHEVAMIAMVNMLLFFLAGIASGLDAGLSANSRVASGALGADRRRPSAVAAWRPA